MKRKGNKILILLALLLAVTIGYALISTTLKITGTANLTKQEWDISWGVPQVVSGSISSTAPTRTQDTDDPANTKLIWTINLTNPGDFYEFTVDAINNGTMDAMISRLDMDVTPQLPSYIKYSVTYDSGATPEPNHKLAKKTNNTSTKEKYRVRVYYDPVTATTATLDDIPSGGITYTFSFGVTYIPATTAAVTDRMACPGPNCVYAYYVSDYSNPGKMYSNTESERSTLTGYTSDYTTLKYSNNEQRRIFLGHILDDNDKIIKGFVCGVKNVGEANEQVYCIEGTRDGSKYNTNVGKVQQLWNNTCYAHPVGGIMCDIVDYQWVLVYTSGSTMIAGDGILSGNGGCWAGNNGYMACGATGGVGA